MLSFECWGLIVDYFIVEWWYLCIMLPLRWSWPPLWLLWHTFLAGPVWGMSGTLFFTCLFMCCTCLYMSVTLCWWLPHYHTDATVAANITDVWQYCCPKDICLTLLLLSKRYISDTTAATKICVWQKGYKYIYICYYCCHKISIYFLVLLPQRSKIFVWHYCCHNHICLLLLLSQRYISESESESATRIFLLLLLPHSWFHNTDADSLRLMLSILSPYYHTTNALIQHYSRTCSTLL